MNQASDSRDPSAHPPGDRDATAGYRRFFDDDLTGDFVSSPDGRILSCNAAFARIFGYASPAEAASSNANLHYHTPESRGRLLELLARHRKLELHEIECRRVDGTPVHLVENLIGVFDERGELKEIHGFVLDNTERKRLEEQLRQSQKMEAVGRLAGGIAHDFDNILGVVRGYAQTLAERAQGDPEMGQDVQAILEAAERGMALTHQLLAVSRHRTVEPRILNLNEVVDEMSRFLRRTVGRGIELTTRLDPGLGPVMADRSQVEQVLINLTVNGRDAMPEGGEILIETANAEVDDPLPIPPGEPAKKAHVRLTFSDTGTGMDPVTQERIFEPFFTSKEHGTGLGLAIIYGIVRQAGGFIEVTSAVGMGSTFNIYLPSAAAAGGGAPRPVPARSAEPAAAGGCILVVEDEPALRRLVVQVLVREGYRVREAARGTEALRLFHEDGSIRLLLTDMDMPDMNGGELGTRLKALRPGLRVLYMSGAAPESLEGIPGLESESFLAKPFSPEAVVERVRRLMPAGGTQ